LTIEARHGPHAVLGYLLGTAALIVLLAVAGAARGEIGRRLLAPDHASHGARRGTRKRVPGSEGGGRWKTRSRFPLTPTLSRRERGTYEQFPLTPTLSGHRPKVGRERGTWWNLDSHAHLLGPRQAVQLLDPLRLPAVKEVADSVLVRQAGPEPHRQHVTMAVDCGQRRGVLEGER
jgi:hypothetical protein